MPPLKTVVIGAGAIGRTHIDLVSRHAHCCLVAIVDSDPAAGAVADGHGVPLLREIDEALVRAGAEAAIIATPTELHFEHAQACLALGLPVLLEKPVTATSDEALTLDAYARSLSIPVLVGHHRRHSPIIETARKSLLMGDIGDVVAVSGHFLLGKPTSYFHNPWRRTAKSGGPILTNLIHDIDCLRFLVGEVDTVAAISSSSRRGHAMEDSAAVVLRFGSGAIGTLIGSDITPGPFSWEFSSGEDANYPKQDRMSYVISGTAGTLEIPALELWTQPGAVDWHKPLVRRRLDAPGGSPLMRQLDHFRQVALGAVAPLVSVADAARTLDVVSAIREAASTARWCLPGG